MAMFPGRETHATNPTVFSGLLRPGAWLCLPVLLVPILGLLSPGVGSALVLDQVGGEMASAAFVTVTDTLVVRAGAMAGLVSPSVAGVVTRVDLQQETGSRDLVSLLASVAGLQVRRYGGLGFAGVPSVRGSSAAQIRVFLDGMPLDDSQSGAIDLSHLPLERFQAAEIHRGVVPVSLGGIGGAGAINLITRENFAGTDIRLFTGSFGDRGGRITWGSDTGDGNRSILLMAHGRKADNDYSFSDHLQTFHDTSDDSTRVRENAGFEEFGFWGTGRLKTGSLSLRFSGGHFRKDGGRPGPLNYPSPAASVRNGRTAGHLALDYADGLLHGDISGGRTEQVYYPAKEVGWKKTIASLADDVTARLAFAPKLFRGTDFLLGVEHRYQAYRQWYNADEDPRRNRKSITIFSGINASVFDGRGSLALAMRWQRNEDDFPELALRPEFEDVGVLNSSENLSPSLGILWKIHPGTLTMAAHASRSVRVPNWVELFGHRGGNIAGNRELEPEEITAADLGLTWQNHGGDRSCRLVAFVASTEQAIIFKQNSPATSRAENYGQTKTGGVELEGALKLPADFDVMGNLTWQHARDRSDDLTYQGNSIPYLSDTDIQLRLGRSGTLWHPWVETAWKSSFYRDRYNNDASLAPEQFTMNAGITYQMHPAWLGSLGVLEISAEVINLTDNTVYDMEEYPLPGRRFHVSMRIQQ